MILMLQKTLTTAFLALKEEKFIQKFMIKIFYTLTAKKNSDLKLYIDKEGDYTVKKSI
jgi:hypothetical protein